MTLLLQWTISLNCSLKKMQKCWKKYQNLYEDFHWLTEEPLQDFNINDSVRKFDDFVTLYFYSIFIFIWTSALYLSNISEICREAHELVSLNLQRVVSICILSHSRYAISLLVFTKWIFYIVGWILLFSMWVCGQGFC